MKLLITGAAGFIGSNFTAYMNRVHPEYDLVCVDSLTYAGNMDTINRIGNGFRFFRIDISDKDEIFRLFKKEHFDIAVNFAAETHVDRSIEQPEVFLKTNILGTHTLLEACRNFGIERFHQISTDEVYGDLPLDRPDLTFDETYALRTSSPYSASKAAADLLALSYARTYGLPITISRCSNNYGPFQFPEKLIPLTIVNALHGKKIPIYGTGRNRRDWIFVEDHCSAVDLILQKGRPGEVYNVGCRNEQTNLDVVRAILKKLGKTEDLMTFVTDRPGHDLRYAINPEKIQTELGWHPETDFESGIGRTVEWYLENRDWWENILSGHYRTLN